MNYILVGCPWYIPFNVKSSKILAALLIHSISLDQAKIFANFLLSLFRGIKQNLLHSHEFNLSWPDKAEFKQLSHFLSNVTSSQILAAFMVVLCTWSGQISIKWNENIAWSPGSQLFSVYRSVFLTHFTVRHDLIGR